MSKHSFMEEMMRVLVADGDAAARGALIEGLPRRGFAVYGAADGALALRQVEALQPDILLLSLALPQVDGIGVLENLRKRFLSRYPYIFILSMGEYASGRALELGADGVLERPATPDAVCALLSGLVTAKPPKLSVLHMRARAQMAERQLEEIGMPMHLKGAAYLAKAVAAVSSDGRMLRQTTSVLYPRIARETGVTGNSVERAIRHAIETTWTRGSVDALHSVFGNSIDPQRGKPTNTECIAMFAEQLNKRIVEG